MILLLKRVDDRSRKLASTNSKVKGERWCCCGRKEEKRRLAAGRDILIPSGKISMDADR